MEVDDTQSEKWMIYWELLFVLHNSLVNLTHIETPPLTVFFNSLEN